MFHIYDKNETNFTTFGLAVLKDIRNPVIHRKINSTYELEFEYPILPDDDKLQYIQKENIVKADGQLFRITHIEKVDSGYQQWIKIKAPHIFFDLIDYYTEDRRVENASVQTALEVLLEGTPFSVGQCDDCGLATAYFIEENKLKSINDKIIPCWGCEIEIDGFTVIAKRRIGQDRKYHIRRGKNLRGITYTEDISNVITRLYPKGRDGLTIESVNNGRKYIDSPYIGNYSHIKAGEVTFADIEDPQELLIAAQDYLANVDKPYVHYDIDLVELRDSVEYRHFRELEKFDLGDTVYVYNDKLGIDIEARILEYEYNPVKRRNSRVVLGNFTNQLEDILGQFEDAKRRIDNSITEDGHIRTNWLQGEINTLVNRLIASGAYHHAQVFEDKGYLLENTDETSPDYGALYIGPGIFAIANSKKPDGSWDWRTFGTGRGFTGDLITAGKVKAQFLQIGSQTEFEQGYDPSEKETPEGAQAKVDAGKQDVITYVNTELQVRDGRIEAKADKTTVDELGNRISEAEAQLAVQANEIATKVSQTDFNLLEGRVTSAESTLTQHANEIALRVRKDELGSEIVQNADSVKIAVGQIGGNNLIKNSDFKFGLKGWELWNYPQTTLTEQPNGYSDVRVYCPNVTSSFGIITPRSASIRAGRKYTLSFEAVSYFWTPVLDYVYIMSASRGNYRLPNIAINATDTNFRLYQLTFEAPYDADDVGILIGKIGVNKVDDGFRIRRVKLEEGENATAWSPHPSEMYGTTYIFDGDSFKIGGSANDRIEISPTYVQAYKSGVKRVHLDYDSLDFYDTDSRLTAHIYAIPEVLADYFTLPLLEMYSYGGIRLFAQQDGTNYAEINIWKPYASEYDSAPGVVSIYTTNNNPAYGGVTGYGVLEVSPGGIICDARKVDVYTDVTIYKGYYGNGNLRVDGWVHVNGGTRRVVSSSDSYARPTIASTSRYSPSGAWVTWDYPDFSAAPNIIHSDYNNLGTKVRNVTASSCEVCMAGTATGYVKAIAVGGV